MFTFLNRRPPKYSKYAPKCRYMPFLLRFHAWTPNIPALTDYVWPSTCKCLGIAFNSWLNWSDHFVTIYQMTRLCFLVHRLMALVGWIFPLVFANVQRLVVSILSAAKPFQIVFLATHFIPSMPIFPMRRQHRPIQLPMHTCYTLHLASACHSWELIFQWILFLFKFILLATTSLNSCCQDTATH